MNIFDKYHGHQNREKWGLHEKLLSSVRQIKCIYNSIKITKKHF